MTYLFVLIGISVINALAGEKFSLAELVFTNLVVIAFIFGLERLWLQDHELSKTIVYDNPGLVLPEKRQELIGDLVQRTGLDIYRVEIGRINFSLNDKAHLVLSPLRSGKAADNAYLCMYYTCCTLLSSTMAQG